MRNLVLWSGGCDSTLLLYYLSKNNPNDNILLGSDKPYGSGNKKAIKNKGKAFNTTLDIL